MTLYTFILRCAAVNPKIFEIRRCAGVGVSSTDEGLSVHETCTVRRNSALPACGFRRWACDWLEAR